MKSVRVTSDQREAIYNTHFLLFIHVARIQEDDEMVYLIIDARGNDKLGYIASLDFWHANASGKFQFIDCYKESDICTTLEEAVAQARSFIRAATEGNPEWVITGL